MVRARFGAIGRVIWVMADKYEASLRRLSVFRKLMSIPEKKECTTVADVKKVSSAAVESFIYNSFGFSS
jgi:hypothetical protein